MVNVAVSIFEFINIGSRLTLSTPVARFNAKGQVSLIRTLTTQTPGQSNVIGNLVNIKDTDISDSNQNCSHMQNVSYIHVHFLC